MMGRNSTVCAEAWRWERYDAVGEKIVIAGESLNNSCVVVLDLASMHSHAAGFRRGFLGGTRPLSFAANKLHEYLNIPVTFQAYPYAYLSPGQFSVAARINVEGSQMHSHKVCT